jgi:alkylation response protein AidB-like acyl-CoA dehydrogenase
MRSLITYLLSRIKTEEQKKASLGKRLFFNRCSLVIGEAGKASDLGAKRGTRTRCHENVTLTVENGSKVRAKTEP